MPRRRSRRSRVSRFWWVLAVALVALVGGAWHAIQQSARRSQLSGYIYDAKVLIGEYRHFHGKPLVNRSLTQNFAYAGRQAERGDTAGAVALLEHMSQQVPVPALYNDLGILYAILDDRPRALAAFRDALARDANYSPAKQNVERFHSLLGGSADPINIETEPNNTNQFANVIALGKTVEGEISGMADVDCFRFAAPPPPRDILQIDLQSRADSLSPKIRVFDQAGNLLDWRNGPDEPRPFVTRPVSAAPNSTIYVNVMGDSPTGGRYSVTVHALKAYDAYEPDDDIATARRVTVGQRIEANIMDAEDVDIYSFASPQAGTIEIKIQPLSGSLIPALAFGADPRNLTSGPTLEIPGTTLGTQAEVQLGSIFYIQVSSQGKTAGPYALTLQ